jgi:hypothetical protein
MGLTISDSSRDSGGSRDNFMALTEAERDAIESVERIGASLSLVGVLLIIVTFAAFKRLRTVPNTFILFASIANIGASVACLIGYAGVLNGDGSATCQAQAFLLEMYVGFESVWLSFTFQPIGSTPQFPSICFLLFFLPPVSGV